MANYWERALRIHEALEKRINETESTPVANMNSMENNLQIVKKTKHPNSFSVSTQEFNQILSAAQSGKNVMVKVVSAIDQKPIAVLDKNDVKVSFLQMKPTLDPDMRGADYFAVKIPKTAFAKVRGKGPGAY